MPGTWAFAVERVTRIELALSAWEAERLLLLGALTSQVSWPPSSRSCPLVPVVNGPLMARRSCADLMWFGVPVPWSSPSSS
jgi:hypothetical protein